MEEFGAGEILLTSMDRDGTKDGYDIDLDAGSCRCRLHSGYRIGRRRQPGALYDGFTRAGASACLAASIFHYREYTIAEAKEYLKDRGVPVRL